MRLRNQFLASALSWVLMTGLCACEVVAQDAAPTPQPALQPAQVTAEQLQQLVAPIALYPDELVAQVLAAATYPAEIVEANRWLQQNSSLKDAQLADAVDKQPWDPSVKALTQFPSVLANMDKNLSWTSALGDARSPTFFNRRFGAHGPDFRDAPGHGFPARGAGFRGGPIDHRADRGFAEPHMAPSQHPAHSVDLTMVA